MEPGLHRQGLQWLDVQTLLESVDTQDELQQALNNPESFLKQLLAGAGGQVARKLLLSKLKPLLEPYLQQQSLTWVDVQPALELVDSLAELEAASSNPEAFFKKLLKGGGPAARRMLIAQLRPRMEPRLHQHGLQWSDAQAMLEAVDTLDELQKALNDPESFLKQLLVGASGQVARKLLLSKLKPLLEPHLQQQSLAWADVQPALELVDSLAELEEASSNPEAFFKKLLKGGGPAARRMLIAQLRPRMEPRLHQEGLEWSDLQPMLESVDTQDELQKALSDPESFLTQL
jgi:hypothetical protein